MKRITCIVLVVLLLSTVSGYSHNLQDTASYLGKQQLDEWGVLALYSYGQNVKYKQLEDVDESNVTTDYEAFIMGAIPRGLDVSKYAKKIIKSQREDGKFADFIDGKGSDLVNAHIWGIISLYVANEKSYNKEKALKWLKENQNKDGGFSVYTGGGDSDIDMTAMGVVAYNILGLSHDSLEIQSAIDFIERNLSKKESCESVAWYILAITKLHINVDESLYNKMLEYRLSDGAFKHLKVSNKGNYMATWHAFLAQTDYINKTSIFERLHNLNRFSDLKASDYAYKEMMALVNKGVLSGYSDGTLKPNNHVKRAEFTKLLIYGLDLQDEILEKTNQFSDLKNHWSNKIVKAAVDRGLINGMEPNKFYPESKITGAQIAAILVRYKGLQDKAEVVQGEKWYEGYVEIAKKESILYDQFNPEEFATRAQCAQAIYKLMK